MDLCKEIMNEITLYCRDECCSSQECPEEACVLFRIERRVLSVNLERAKELLKILITDYQNGCISGEPFSDDDVINYLFTLDFTEEELLELGFSEEAIDSANVSNMSAPEQFE